MIFLIMELVRDISQQHTKFPINDSIEKKPPEYENQAARVPVLNWFFIGSNNNWFHLTFGESPMAIIIGLERK